MEYISNLLTHEILEIVIEQTPGLGYTTNLVIVHEE
jgi:hypothetical protein